jgi:putative phage-type endonuclease
MSFTPEQLIERRQWLGASEVAAAIGQSPYMTPNELFWLKRPDLLAEEVEPEQLDNEAIKNGNMTEEINIMYAERKGGWKTGELLRQPVYERGFMKATLDGLDPKQGIVVEAKFTGQIDFELWGDPDSDRVPPHYYIQCVMQMLCACVSECHLYVIFPTWHGFGHTRYIIRMDENNAELARKIYAIAEAFWVKHVEAGIPPDPSAPAPDFIINNIVRVTEKEIVLEGDGIESHVAEYLEVREHLKFYNDRKDTLRGLIMTAMGDATKALIGSVTFTAKQQTRSTLDVAGIRAKHPTIAKEFTKTSTSTVLNLKEPKS